MEERGEIGPYVFNSVCYVILFVKLNNNEPFREKTNIMDSALSIVPDQPKHAAQANPDRHFSTPVNFLFQESLLYNSIPLRRNESQLRGFLFLGFAVTCYFYSIRQQIMCELLKYNDS